MIISYARFSSQKQGQEGRNSTRRQEELAQQWASKRGLTVDSSLMDSGVSGFRGKNAREGSLAGFLSLCEAGRIPPGSYLLIEQIDRISRQPPMDTLELIQSIIKHGVTIVTMFDGAEYSRESLNANTGQIYILLGAIQKAHAESSDKSKRMSDVWAQRKKTLVDGVAKRTIAPLWLSWGKGGYSIIPERGEIVKRIYRESIEGKGIYQIVAGLVRDEIPAWSKGGKWTPGYVNVTLAKRHVLGECEIGGVVIPDYFPAVVDSETWERARIARESRQCNVGGGDGVPHLFAGIVKCACCGQTMIRHQQKNKKGGRTSYLQCMSTRVPPRCEAVKQWRFDDFEPLVLRWIIDQLDIETLSGNGVIRKELRDCRESLNQRKGELESANTMIESWIDELPGMPDVAKARIYSRIEKQEARIAVLKEDVERLTREESRLSHATAIGGDVLDTLKADAVLALADDAQGRERLRNGLKSVIERVEVATDHRLAIVFFRSGIQRLIHHGGFDDAWLDAYLARAKD